MQVLTALLVLSLCLFPSLAAAAAPHIYDVPQAGPPESQTTVLGNGFDPNATLDVYFDSTAVGVVTTDNNGSFGMALRAPTIRQNGLTITIPNNAVPGSHWITAKERNSQLTAQVAFTVKADWPQFHFDAQHTGFNPYENVLGPGTVGKLTSRWKYAIGGQVSTSPTVAHGIVYAAAINADSHLYAFDAGTGTLLWTFWGGTLCNAVAVANDIVYFTSCFNYSGHNYLIALDAGSGAYRWSYEVGDYSSSPVVVNGVAYAGSSDGNVYAVNASTGALLWKYAGGDSSYGTPTVAGGIVYVGSSNSNFYALDAGTGALIWKLTTEWSYDGGTPAVVNGVVYATSFDEPTNGTILYALEAKTGALVWKYTFTGSTFDPAVANGVVYMPVGAYDDNVYALDAGTGAVLWKYQLTGIEAGGPSAAAVANGIVYFGIQYNNDQNGVIDALNATTGALLWQYTTGVGAGFNTSPAIVNGMLYIGCDDGKLYTFGLPNQQMAEKVSPPERPDPARLTPNPSDQARHK